MAVKMRLTRIGDKKTNIFRIVVSDSKTARDGIYIEQVGFYNPKTDPATIKVDTEKAQSWISKGAQPTDTVRALLKKNGIELKGSNVVKKYTKKAVTEQTEKKAKKK